MAQVDQFKKDMFLEIEGVILQVIDRKYKTQGRQGGILILSLQNVETGQILTKTVKSGTKFEQIIPDFRKMQFLYADTEYLNFMDMGNYESLQLPLALVGDYIQYMKEGIEYSVMFHNGKAISFKKEQSVELEITESVDAVKGNTAQSAFKIVTTQTGLKVEVPLFIKTGDVISINTETGQYTGRV